MGTAGIGAGDLWHLSQRGPEHRRPVYIPWYSVAIAVGSVFVVVFATMLYATRKIRSENPIEALKQENL